MKGMPFFSLLIPFRDRDLPPLLKCLDSIALQTFQDFEVVFLDYGSQPALGEALKETLQKYSFLHYRHTETRGRLWSRSEALNILLWEARGAYVVVLDADVQVGKTFLELAYAELQKLASPTLLELRFWETLPNGLRVKLRTSRSIFTAQRDFLIEKGGYDTFFKTWGVEDVEMMRRISPAVGQNPVFVSEKAPLIHLWHPIQMDLRPKGWVDFLMYQYLPHKQQNPDKFPTTYLPPVVLAYKDRPVLQKMQARNQEGVTHFRFGFPVLYHYTQFLARFATLRAGEFLCVEQEFTYYAPDNQSFMRKIINFCNGVLGKLRFSYRLVDIPTFETAYLPLLQVRDFLFYFLINYEAQIADYFFEHDEQKITFWVCRKIS